MKRLEFWFDYASTYSYLSTMRIEAMTVAAGVEVVWRPFLLGPVFKAQGWETSPFNIYPAKGRYMVRDMERLAAVRGLAFRLPPSFPRNSLKAARVGMIGLHEGWIAPFSRAVFEAEFAHGEAISDNSVLTRLLLGLEIDPERVLRESESAPAKEGLRHATAEAIRLGIFGAPTFRTPDGELFWGDDRLEQAVAWCEL